jgi:hypothetical protein
MARHGKGLDIGTVNLVAAEEGDDGQVMLRNQRNAFIDIPVEDESTKVRLTQLKVPYVVYGKRMYVIGDTAFDLANVLNKNLRRPMKDGLLSPKEVDAVPIMKLIIENVLGQPREEGENCYYCVPAEPIDSELNVAYHRDVFNSVISKLGYKPSSIVEGQALVLAELAEDDFTGIGISCGGGMFNVSVSYKSLPCLTFSTSRAGDWVDGNVARVLGIKPPKAQLIKEKKIKDLLKPGNREEEAVSIYYRELIKYTFSNIAERFRNAENMPEFPDPICVVMGGGTSLVPGFISLVKDEVKKLDFPIPIREIRHAEDPFYAVAKGCLMGALTSQG